MKSNIVFRNQFSDDFQKFVNRSGNGKSVPQFEVKEIYGRRQGIIVPIKDKSGKQVCKNLYREIQECGIGQSILELLNTNPELMKNFGDNPVSDFKDKGMDISNLSEFEFDDYLNEASKLKAKYGELANVEKAYKQNIEVMKAEILKKQKELLERKVSNTKKEDGKEVKDNE